jgi:hypothetical protein
MLDSEVVAIVYSELLKIAGGATVVLAGLSIFLSKLWSERIARREGEQRDRHIAELKAQLDQQAALVKARLDASVQRRIHVSKMQFDHEYEIYRLAWEKLFALRNETSSYRFVLEEFDPNESKHDWMSRRVKAFQDQYTAFLDVIEKNKPFYPPTIYKALSDVRNECMLVMLDIGNAENPSPHLQARTKQQRLSAVIEAACEAIRRRVSEVDASEA